MARRLAGTVVLRSPETGSPTVFEAGSDVPAWAADLITNPAAWDGDADSAAEQAEQAETNIPRPDGRAGRDAWAAYATSLGIEIADDADKGDIRAAVDAAQQ